MLPSRVVEAFESLRKGSVFPFAWLGTVAQPGPVPRVRTVKVCGFNMAARCFHVCCHSKHDKIAELQANPAAELCLVDFELGIQLRLRCRVEVQPEKDMALRERFWAKLSPRSKIELYQGHPQQPKPAPNFVLLRLNVASVELLELKGEPPVRLRYRDLEGQPEKLDF